MMSLNLLVNDVRQAIRQLRRDPLFFGLVALILALGIGANIMVFTIVDAGLSRVAPGVTDSDRLMRVGLTPGPDVQRGFERNMSRLSYVDIADIGRRTDMFEAVAGWQAGRVVAGNANGVASKNVMFVTNDYFRVLGVDLERGAGFANRGASAGNIAIISHAYWQDAFAGDASALGASITVNGKPATVVGIAPARFTGASPGEQEEQPVMWVPAEAIASLISRGSNDSTGSRKWDSFYGRDARRFEVTALLRAGVTKQQAAAVASATIRNASDAMKLPKSERSRGVTVAPLREPPPGAGEEVLFIGAAGAGIATLILLIACANASNLLMGRAALRRREIAVRLALGAGRARVVRQLLAECVIVALVASGLGLYGVHIATGAMERLLLRPLNLQPDAQTVLFAVLFATLTGLVFGLVPALHGTRVSVSEVLKSATAGLDYGKSKLQNGLVSAQIALAIPLIAGAGMLIMMLVSSIKSDTGYSAAPHLAAASMELNLSRVPSIDAPRILSEIRARAAAIPGVESASISSCAPIGNCSSPFFVMLTDPRTSVSRNFSDMAAMGTAVDANYLATVGVKVTRGRGILPSDVKGSEVVAVVSEDIARRKWLQADPIGQTLELTKGVTATVVGVTRTTRDAFNKEEARVYVSRLQVPDTFTSSIIVRTAPNAEGITGRLAKVVRDVEPRLAVSTAMTMNQARREHLDDGIRALRLALASGLVALGLASIGIYAVISYAVRQRSREIAIRMTVGGTHGAVAALFLRRGLRLTMWGMAVGIPVAVLMRLGLDREMGGPTVSLVNGAALASVIAVVTIVAAVASWIPARRVAAVDPLVALRVE